MAVLEIADGNLFHSQLDAIAIPVNTLGVMGAGLALACRRKHPDAYYVYKQQCRYQKFHLDSLLLYRPAQAPYRLLFVPTKGDWKDTSTLDQIRNTVKHIHRLISRGKLASVALPALGCGHGQLAYPDVRQIVIDQFAQSKSRIELYVPRY